MGNAILRMLVKVLVCLDRRSNEFTQMQIPSAKCSRKMAYFRSTLQKLRQFWLCFICTTRHHELKETSSEYCNIILKLINTDRTFLTLQLIRHVLLTISISSNRITSNMHYINCKTAISVSLTHISTQL